MQYSTSHPSISVIVCHHTGDLLFGFLESVFKSEEVSFEVIVMTSNEELAKKGIKDCLVIHSISLPAGKRNEGARIAKGKYLAFFDDDVTIDPNCLFHLRDMIDHENAMTYGKLWNMEFRDRLDEAGGFMTSSGFIWSRAGQHDKDEGQFSKAEHVLAGKSASCMISAKVFKQIGGFDESFGILGEETDLSWRVWLSGKKVLYVPYATGFHAFNTKFKPIEKHYTSERVHFNGCRNYITMLIKNLGKEHLWIIPIHWMIWTFAGVAMLITGKMKAGWNILKGQWYVISHLKSILAKRQSIQGARLRNERELWPLIFRKTPKGYYKNRFLRYLHIGLHG